MTLGRESGKGLFITFEGVEGTGKSTHARRLAERINEEAGASVVLTREPGGTDLGENLRGLLLDAEDVPSPRAELMMMLAARAQHVEQILVPALNRGSVVICDRFSDATLAYQAGGRGLDLAAVARADRLATGGLIPDITFLLEASPEQCRARLGRRKAKHSNRMDQESAEFYQAVSDQYRKLAEEEPGRIHPIQSDASIQATSAAVWSVVGPRLAAFEKTGNP